jgi:hypothetical protein
VCLSKEIQEWDIRANTTKEEEGNMQEFED